MIWEHEMYFQTDFLAILLWNGMWGEGKESCIDEYTRKATRDKDAEYVPQKCPEMEKWRKEPLRSTRLNINEDMAYRKIISSRMQLQ
jgi:hypothetical protein